ncbi:hypothetical protein F2P81_017671 [Scophthalmus maximus]|uniref:Uncharacterized protein n=1 Tax=Scophthalmus maximus TaxID=52904 RepID=A0A6A4SGC1_SCOMX|nr:hypothetical protein F2P81_017671 [Scophthalmus maximus]
MAPVETRRSLLPVLLSLILLQLVVTATQEGAWHDHTHGRPGSELHDQTSCCSWKRLVFTLQWPGGFCQVIIIIIIIIDSDIREERQVVQIS